MASASKNKVSFTKNRIRMMARDGKTGKPMKRLEEEETYFKRVSDEEKK